MQLDLIPNSVLEWMDRSDVENCQKGREEFSKYWFDDDTPAKQNIDQIFDRLVRASGLDDRSWEVHVVRAPSKQPLT